MLIATKLDLLQKRFEHFATKERKLWVNNALADINRVLVSTISTNQINLKIHKFNDLNTSEEFVFFPLKNRKLNVEKSGLSIIRTILVTQYDNVEHSISATVQHKIVLEAIRKLYRASDLKKFAPKSFVDHWSSASVDSDPRTLNLGNKRNDLLSVAQLKEYLMEEAKVNNSVEVTLACDNIHKILSDLNKVGVIAYIERDLLKDIIIPEPKWLNNIFKSIVDYGRKALESLLEEIYLAIKEIEGENALKLSRGQKEGKIILALDLEDTIKWIKGKASKSLSMEQIWRNAEEKKLSNVSKISFGTLMGKLERVVLQLGKQDPRYSELAHKYRNVCQSICVVSEEKLNIITNHILGDEVFLERPKRQFIIDLLIKFEFFLPKEKQSFSNDKHVNKKQQYIVPLLFPVTKPPFVRLFGGKVALSRLIRENVWNVQYELPFKPSSIWKMLNVRIRHACMECQYHFPFSPKKLVLLLIIKRNSFLSCSIFHLKKLNKIACLLMRCIG